MKVVYIASLSHSGSTVLNLCLGGHLRLIARYNHRHLAE